MTSLGSRFVIVVAIVLAGCTVNTTNTPEGDGGSSDSGAASDTSKPADGGAGDTSMQMDLCTQLPVHNTCPADSTDGGWDPSFCQALTNPQAGCSSQFRTLLGCYLSAPVMCDANGSAGYLDGSSTIDTTGACGAQFTAYASCMASGPDAGGD
jgi:hypothetical protein